VDDAICQCGFAVVNMGNNGKITDMLHEAQNNNPVESGGFAKREF
jgi:hypothetical protein